jgi:Icc-related predicted phosphoesterase
MCEALTAPRPVVEHASHLHVRLPVPAHVPPHRLLCVSDTHDLHEGLPHPLPKADILVHAGDLTCQGRRDELENVSAWFDDLLATGTVREIVVIAGNHELSFEGTAKVAAVRRAQAEMKRSFMNRPHVHYLEDTGCEVLGLRFFGTPWTVAPKSGRPWAFQRGDDDADEALGGRFRSIPDGLDVLISHQPPLGVGDGGEAGAHPGSAVLLKRALAAKPRLHVFGHVHSGHGVHFVEQSTTIFVNAALCNDDYKPVQRPVLVECVHDVDGHCT